MQTLARLLVGPLLLSMAATLATSGFADRGVGVSVGEMKVETVLSPGSSYKLPPISVVNTGDEHSDYLVSIGYLVDQQQMQPRADWLEFEPQRFSLDPDVSADVVARLVLPSDAAPGEYFALVKAQTVAQSEGSSVGVAAATKLSFSVESSGWLESRARQVNRWLYDGSPWTYLLPAALLLGFLALKFGRVPFRVRFERR